MLDKISELSQRTKDNLKCNPVIAIVLVDGRSFMMYRKVGKYNWLPLTAVEMEKRNDDIMGYVYDSKSAKCFYSDKDGEIKVIEGALKIGEAFCAREAGTDVPKGGYLGLF